MKKIILVIITLILGLFVGSCKGKQEDLTEYFKDVKVPIIGALDYKNRNSEDKKLEYMLFTVFEISKIEIEIIFDEDKLSEMKEYIYNNTLEFSVRNSYYELNKKVYKNPEEINNSNFPGIDKNNSLYGDFIVETMFLDYNGESSVTVVINVPKKNIGYVSISAGFYLPYIKEYRVINVTGRVVWQKPGYIGAEPIE